MIQNLHVIALGAKIDVVLNYLQHVENQKHPLELYQQDLRVALGTPSGRVQIHSEAYADLGFTAVPAYRGLRADDMYPLMLVTPKSRFRVNSQNDNIPWFRAREPHGLWMNPRDAEDRGIGDGGVVQVTSPQGRVRVKAIVTEDIMPGVVCLLEGVWPIFDSEGVDTAGSVNFLTSTVPTEPSKGARTHSVLVQVTKA